MHKIYFIILLIGLFSSCIEVVDLDVEETPHELVVNCFFTEGQPFAVNVSRLAPYTDIADRNIENATVSIYENEILKGTLKHIENGIYTDKSISPVFGNMYSVKVEVPGYQTAKASDTLPKKIPIDEYFYKPRDGKNFEGTYYSEVAVKIMDRPGDSFYTIRVLGEYEKEVIDNNGIRKKEKYKSPIEIFTKDPTMLSEGISQNDYNEFFVFNDILFQNNQYNASVRFNSYYSDDNNIQVFLESGTKNYFQYHKRLLNHEHYDYGNPFKPYSPVPLFSNIREGQGIFAGYQRDIIRIKTH